MILKDTILITDTFIIFLEQEEEQGKKEKKKERKKERKGEGERRYRGNSRLRGKSFHHQH